jgi:hypothetical protein
MSSSAMPTRWRSWSDAVMSDRQIVGSQPASLSRLAGTLKPVETRESQKLLARGMANCSVSQAS